MFSSEFLLEGAIYTRSSLSEKFGIKDATINTGVFPLTSYHAIWLFITEKKTADAPQYNDLLEGDTLFWDGQMEGHKDKNVINHEANNIELLVFYRKKKNEFAHNGFKYEGRFRYIEHTDARPAHFTLQRVKTVPTTSLKEAKATYKEGPNTSINTDTSSSISQAEKADIAPKPLKVVVCYAREDEKLRKKLSKHLNALKRIYPIASWFDGEIDPGSNWEQEIATHLNEAHIILLLISADFLDSNYCYDVEMKKAIERHEQRETCVIPIILRPSHWQDTPLGKIQALPRNGRSVTDRRWGSFDYALHQVVDEIKEIIKRQQPI